VSEADDVLLGRAELERASTALGERLARLGVSGDHDEPVRHRNSSRSALTSGSLLSRPLSSSSVTVRAVIAWSRSKNRGAARRPR
jgi:hypothetical protein